MKRNKLFLLTVLFIATLVSVINGQGKTRIGQMEMVNFPKNGEVKIEVVETLKKPTKVVFTNDKKKKIASFTLKNEDRYIPFQFESAVNPITRFRVLKNIEGFPQPLIQAVAINPGGSDHSFWNILFAEIDGKIRMLTPNTTENSIQGGVYFGSLGKEVGVGMAVFNFIWDEKEAHYADHRYKVDLYKFDEAKGTMVLSKSLTTKEKHKNKSEALKELGFGYFQNRLNDWTAIEDFRVDDSEYIENVGNAGKDNKSADEFYKRGKEFINQNNDNAALTAFDKAAELGSNEPEVYFYRGQILADSGEYTKAVENFTKALELQPDYAAALNLRANAYADWGYFDKAIADADEYIKRESDGEDGESFRFVRGTFYQRKGDKEKAAADFREVLKINPDDEAAKQALEDLNLTEEKVVSKAKMIFENETADAALDFLNGYPEFSKLPEIKHIKAVLYLNLGDTEKADENFRAMANHYSIKGYRDSKEVLGEAKQPHYWVIVLEQILEDFRRVESTFNKIFEVDEIRYAEYKKLGLTPDAAKLKPIKEGAKRFLSDLAFEKGNLHFKLGKDEVALKFLEESTKLNPTMKFRADNIIKEIKIRAEKNKK